MDHLGSAGLRADARCMLGRAMDLAERTAVYKAHRSVYQVSMELCLGGAETPRSVSRRTGGMRHQSGIATVT